MEARSLQRLEDLAGKILFYGPWNSYEVGLARPDKYRGFDGDLGMEYPSVRLGRLENLPRC